MSADTMKMPEPIIEPATIIVESSKPRPRMKDDPADGFDDSGFMNSTAG
jgi:hypothetical protein